MSSYRGSRITKHAPIGWGIALMFVGAIIWGCSGPQPLSVGIRTADTRAYQQFYAQHPQSPRRAYLAWKASTSEQSIEAVAQADAHVSTTKIPFDAHNDPVAVSRGAVFYKAHCPGCHGENVDGYGPAMPRPTPKMDFHTFGKRFAATLHRGAPKAWFKKIHDGYTSEHANPDGTYNKMPPFGDVLAQEQIWLTITHLQSLDKHAVDPTDLNGVTQR